VVLNETVQKLGPTLIKRARFIVPSVITDKSLEPAVG